MPYQKEANKIHLSVQNYSRERYANYPFSRQLLILIRIKMICNVQRISRRRT